MRLVLLREIPADAKLHQQWNALVERLDRPQVFYTYEWALAVQRAYHATLHTLLFLLYGEQESLQGVAALAADNNGRVTFLGATTGDYCDFLSEPARKPEFVASVAEELQRQGLKDITLTNLPADSDSVAALREACRQNGYHCFMRTAYECAQVVFSRLERGKDGKPLAPGKKRVRRFAKAMAKDGEVQFSHSRSWEAVAPVLPQFIQAHVVRFLEIGRISNLADGHRRLFLTELSRLLSGSQWMVLSRMSVAERVYAWHYGFQFQDNWFWYQPTFDSSAERHWPGFCLLTQVIQEAIEIPTLTHLDLGLGSEAYKTKFANATRRTLCVSAHGALLGHWREMARYWMATAINAWPDAERAVRNMVAKVATVQQRVRRSGVRATIRWFASRIAGWIFSREEVFFFQAGSPASAGLEGASLRPINFELLAEGAIQYSEDKETAAYLLRSAARLRREKAEGFALVDGEGRILHLAWVTAFDGFFLSELNAKVTAPGADCVMLFDCWTPGAERGHGYYGQAASLVARHLQEKGKWPWIFSAASNVASVRGLQKAGFERRYSLVRQRVIGWQRIKGETPRLEAASRTEASAHA